MTPEPNTTGTLSRRDYFAAAAMQGMLSNSMTIEALSRTGDNMMVAKCAREYADALIAELDKLFSPPTP